MATEVFPIRRNLQAKVDLPLLSDYNPYLAGLTTFWISSELISRAKSLFFIIGLGKLEQ